MAIITPDFIRALNTAYQKHFQDALGKAESTYSLIATVVASTTASNTYGWLGQFPRMREWIGDRVLKDMAAKGYSIPNKPFEASIKVLRTDIEDDNLGLYTPMVKEMGYAAAVYPDEYVYGLLAKGHLELCYDGQSFFDTDHPVYPEVDGTGTPTTVSNIFTPTTGDDGAAWYLLDTSRTLKPLIFQERKKPVFTYMTKDDDENVFMRNEFRYGVDARSNVGFGFWQMAARSTLELNSENLRKVYDAMRNQKADGGRPLDVRPTLLVVPTTLEGKAQAVIATQRLANGADNPNYNLVKIHATPWLNV